MKSFDNLQDAQSFQPEFHDPFVYATSEVDQQIRSMYFQMGSKIVFGNLISLFALAPLQTIVTSLQLSVSKHKNLFDTEKSRTQQLAKLNTQLTIHQKRKMELAIKAGGTRPYVAPVYGSYHQTIRGLRSQGWIAFYKGTFYRSIHQLIHFWPFLYINLLVSQEELKNSTAKKFIYFFCGKIVLDILSNPFHIQQNRHILQNRLPEFRVFRDFVKDFRKIFFHNENFIGWRFHIINNFISVFTKFPLFIQLLSQGTFNEQKFLLYLLGQTILYPISTGYKRILCQCSRVPGMIPIRYGGLSHSLKLIFFEEGLRGLYRGFGLYSVSIVMKVILLKQILKRKERKQL